MAANIPASLKSADITRFAHRAAQLETAKPVISYWCNYWIVNQILSKGLHNADAESLTYTTNLMDKLEQFKTEHASNDAITDDVAGKAYVEQFGLETFTRADNAIRANKASRQTADTFQAAATFLELLAVWDPLEPEIAAKVKFAKFHALRIAKALKAGEDPNLSNPKQEPDPEEALPALDPNDAEVQALEGTGPKARQASVVEAPDEAHRIQANLARMSNLDQSLHPSRDPSAVRQQRQPSITEVPDEADRLQRAMSKQSTAGESIHPSRAPSVPRPATDAISPLASQDAASFYSSNAQPDVSPVDASSERKPSIGGNYFPVVPGEPSNQTPSAIEAATALDLPTAPSDPSLPDPPTTFASIPPPFIDPNPDGHFIPPPPPGQPAQIPPNFTPQSAPRQPVPQAPPQLRQAPPPQSYIQTIQPTQPQTQTRAAPPPMYSQPPLSAPLPPPPQQPQTTLSPNAVVDEEAMMKAQKHARWAISALNFEDVATAVRELEGALQVLGAR